MRHATPVTRPRPAPAQFEPLIQFIGLLSAILELLARASEIFGFEIPQKDQGV